jgi:hypothetical protein
MLLEQVCGAIMKSGTNPEALFPQTEMILHGGHSIRRQHRKSDAGHGVATHASRLARARRLVACCKTPHTQP